LEELVYDKRSHHSSRPNTARIFATNEFTQARRALRDFPLIRNCDLDQLSEIAEQPVLPPGRREHALDLLNTPFWIALTECAMELMHGKAPGFPSWCNDVARSTEALLASLGRPAARQMDSSAYHVDRMLSSPQESKLLEEISKRIPPTQLGDDKLKTGKNTKIGLSMADRLQALLCGVYRSLKF
jgi:hypothetical protein